MPEYINELTLEENLRAESEITKLKLELEQYALYDLTSDVGFSKDSEPRQAPRYFTCEKATSKDGLYKVYDFLGRPTYKCIGEMKPEEVEEELLVLLEVMHQRGIELTWDEDSYEAGKIYQFITDELFPYEVSLSVEAREGDVWMFCYEDFHVNHQKDLMSYTSAYMEALFGAKVWDTDLLGCSHIEDMVLNGSVGTFEQYAYAIKDFKDMCKGLFCNWKLEGVQYDLSRAEAKVSCSVTLDKARTEKFTINYRLIQESWFISGMNWDLLGIL